MSFEPEKFFIGVTDFFSILMPGALLAYLGKDWLASSVFGQPRFALDSTEQVVVLLFVAYALGHFTFLVGAVFLDNLFYDPIRRCTHLGLIQRLSSGKRLPPALLRRLARSNALFGSSADAAVTKALAIKESALRPLAAERSINAYQWCKARLSKEHPSGLLEVQRTEAHSKFFRSFTVVLLVFCVALGLGHRWSFAAIIAGLTLFAFWRYVNQRFKATQQAYWFVITLEAMSDRSAPASPVPSNKDRITHAGGVVYRRRGKGTEYLLVQSKDLSSWVLPKGHIETGEDPKETAVREVREETGHWAILRREMNDVTFDGPVGPAAARFYLMEACESFVSSPEGRKSGWLTIDEAIERASFPETKECLAEAEEALRESVG